MWMGLKALNHELGHSFGSAALLRVAEVLEGSKRVRRRRGALGG